MYTIHEIHGLSDDIRVAYIGDANNVARSPGHRLRKNSVSNWHWRPPRQYQFDDNFVKRLREEVPNARVEQGDDPVAAVRGAHAVYTDVWASMGQESEQSQRIADFADYQVNEKLMAQAPDHAIFLHCLPAKRGQEVTDEVIDGPQSEVIRQASNRMHAQKGLLAWLLGSQR